MAEATKAAATKTTASDADDTTEARGSRKTREGIVVSIGMEKTAVVKITTRKPHPLYKKTMVRSTNLYAHDEENSLRVGDRVRVAETRPLSKTKRWRLLEILERAK
jgi:small subunit ribosomal protein S17